MKQHLTHVSLILVVLLFAALSFSPYAEDKKEKNNAATEVSETNVISTTAPPPPPSITIGGRDVMQVIREGAEGTTLAIPPELADDMTQYYISRRARLRPFTHNPITGENKNGVTVIELIDLGCIPCIEDLRQVHALLAPYMDRIQLIHMYAPTTESNPLQLSEFYGKVAQKNNKFWDYRERIMGLKNVQNGTYFNLLTQLGIDPLQIRRATVQQSRRFYKELDADAKLIKRSRIKESPIWFVNGIKVGSTGALSIDKLPHLLDYEIDRIKFTRQNEAKR